MDSQRIIAIDPQNRLIIIAPYFMESKFIDESKFIFEYKEIVESPSCIINSADGHLYYFGKVAGGSTFLIKTIEKGEYWCAIFTLKEPSPDYISLLLKKGNFVPGKCIKA